MTQNQTTNYREQGGNRTVIGGSLDVVSGGEIDIESGGSLKVAGTELIGSTVSPVKVKKLAISADFDNTEQDTGWTLPAKCVVLDVFIDVTTADSSQTIDVGTDGSGSNDPDGFLDGASVNGTGIVRGVPTITTGASEVFFASTTRGALLSSLTAGSDSAGDVGTYYENYDVTSGGESVTYTGSDTTNTVRGAIYVVYVELS